MNQNETIAAKRKARGLTQQELADITKVDLRTIQRIEAGTSNPRAFTLKAIENALGFQSAVQPEAEKPNSAEDSHHFLHLFCLSCFSFLVIPYVHFLVPNYLLNRSKKQSPEILIFAKKIIRQQVYWVVATAIVFLVVMLNNFIKRYYTHTGDYINYLVPFFGMYALNIILIGTNIYKVRTYAV